ncbi:MAG TPA: ATP-binding protein [Streptosporangiaceae bacterium]
MSGRRRQGKTYLLRSLAQATDGFFFEATDGTEVESLRMFGAALARHTGSPVGLPFADWEDALTYFFSLSTNRPVPLVIDEFPLLMKASPTLPSLLKREIDLRGPSQAGGSMARVLVCGSAMSVMTRLLSGTAPLRGRAGLELMVRPFAYRDAAEFWNADDPRLAVLLHSIVGGTPAYRRQFVRDDAPDGLRDFDDWVCRTVLDPARPLFREARYLLAEEPDIRDPGLYYSVLAAVANGKTTWGGIAGYVGRKTADIAHPLNVLEDCGLVAKEKDAFRTGRARYRITEPLVAFYETVMRPRWADLEQGLAQEVWRDARPTFSAKVVGPHFEALCREFATRHGRAVFDQPVGTVTSGVVNDPANKTQIEVDVVVLGPMDSAGPRRVVSLGEAKWGEVMGTQHLDRLRRAQALLRGKGFDTDDSVLACYSGAGFADDLRAAAADNRVRLLDLPGLYSN